MDDLPTFGIPSSTRVGSFEGRGKRRRAPTHEMSASSASELSSKASPTLLTPSFPLSLASFTELAFAAYADACAVMMRYQQGGRRGEWGRRGESGEGSVRMHVMWWGESAMCMAMRKEGEGEGMEEGGGRR